MAERRRVAMTWEVIEPGRVGAYRGVMKKDDREVPIMDLTTIVELPWRGVPAAVLALLGLVLLARGLWFGFRGSAGLLRERDALGWMRGFRLAVVGLSLIGIAVAWEWQLFWLFVVSVGIVGEELLETTVIIEVMKRNPPRAPARDGARLAGRRIQHTAVAA